MTCTDSLRAVIESRKPPEARLGRNMFLRMVGGRAGDDDDVMRIWRDMAEAAGVSTTGKVYLSQMAEFPGDPGAWFADIFDVEAAARAKGLRLAGAANCDFRHERPPTESVKASDTVINLEYERLLDLNPMADRRELWEQAKETVERENSGRYY